MTDTERHPINDIRVLLAGGAVFTVSSPNGDHFTYNISLPRMVKVYYDDRAVAMADLDKFNGGSYEGIDSWNQKHTLKVGVRDFQKTETKHDLQNVGVHAPLYVSVLTGPENTADYSYAGIWEDGHLKLTKHSHFNVKGKFEGEWVNKVDWRKALRMRKLNEANGAGATVSRSIEVILWALWLLEQGKALPEGYEIYHMGRCCRCGKALTVPSSIESGLGPVCQGKVLG